MLNSLRTVVLNEKKRPAVKRCCEASEKCRNDQRRGSRQLEADLKIVDRSQVVYEKEAKRLRQQYENSLAGLKSRNSAQFRSKEEKIENVRTVRLRSVGWSSKEEKYETVREGRLRSVGGNSKEEKYETVHAGRLRSVGGNSKEEKYETVHNVRRRSVGGNRRPSLARQNSKPNEPFFVDETRTSWGVGAVDVSSSFLLSNGTVRDTDKDDGHYPHFRRKCGVLPARSSHRYATGITTGSRRTSIPMQPADLPPRAAYPSGKFNYLTQAKEDLVGDAQNRNTPSSRKLWTPKNEKWKMVGQKVIEQLEFDKRMKRRYIPPGHYKVTDIIIL